MAQTYFFHDYETFGVDPARDWPAQFAGIRTDANFEEIEAPVNIYCRLPNDQLPQPEACLVTGITPDLVNSRGVCEAEFIGRICQEFARPNTCSLGYNSIRFDDEVTRNSLYRNFYDPYAREWQNGCSRWDLIDVIRLCAALRPEGIVWPRKEDGTHSFRLEELTAANGITHTDAHDALSDVRATIAIARLVKEKQPKLFNFALTHRDKWKVAEQLDVVSSHPKVVVHVSGKYPAAKQCMAAVVPLGGHPTIKNEVIVYDLSVDPEPLLSLDAEQIRYRMFTPNSVLHAEGVDRIPLKTIRLNRCPVVVPWSVVSQEDKVRLGLDQDVCQQHYGKLFSQAEVLHSVRQKLNEVFSNSKRELESMTDPDHMIYSGGFFSNHDRQCIDQVRSTAPEHLADLVLPFQDARLEEMLFRYRARNWPELLSDDELMVWNDFRRSRIEQGCGGQSRGLEEYLQNLRTLVAEQEDVRRREVLGRLLSYIQNLAAAL